MNANVPINIWNPVVCRVCDVLLPNSVQLLYHFEHHHTRQAVVLSPAINGAPMSFGSQISQIRPHQSTLISQNAIATTFSRQHPNGTIASHHRLGAPSNFIGGNGLRSERNNFNSSMKLNSDDCTLPLVNQLETPFEDATMFCSCQENEDDVNLALSLKH
nr:hypothetical protein A4A49_53445 [Ipomoea batatas]